MHKILLVSDIVKLIIISCTLLFVSCSDWVMPKSLVGTWSSTQETSIRFKKGTMSFRFVKAPVKIVVNILDDGTVRGTVGEANFERCAVTKNRNWVSKMLGLFTDYQISGKLTGSTFAQDTLTNKEINMPFNMKDNIINGTLFQKEGMGVFPMVDIHLIKQ